MNYSPQEQRLNAKNLLLDIVLINIILLGAS
jgi:hypothetical protein